MKQVTTFLRTPYNYDRDAASDESGLKCEDASKTKQSFAAECDINEVVRRFNITGQIPENVRMPTYADFDEVYDFKSALEACQEARESFMMMPAQLRARFHNDPQEFVEFCSQEENHAEAEKMGLVAPKAAPKAAEQPTPTPTPLEKGKETPQA